MRAEWTKLVALRSTRWSLVAAFALTLLITVSVTVGAQPQDNVLELSLGGVYLGQMAVATLGVLAISSEYTSGMIRVTFAATPDRRAVLGAKAAVVGGLVFAAGLVICGASHLVGTVLLGAGVGAPTAVRGIGGTAAYLAALAVLGLGLGALLRHTAAALSTLFAVLWVPLIVVSMLPMETGLQVARWCPMFAGLAISSTGHSVDSIPISPGAGLALFCAYAAAAFGAGLYMIARRDALDHRPM
jgi:hypothetical protein